MFGPLTKLVKNVRSLDQKEILLQIWKDNEVAVFILDLNRVDQLLKNREDSFGDPIGVYSGDRGSVSFKGVTVSKKRNTKYVLYDTGKFFSSFDLVTKKDAAVIKANDVKPDGTRLTEKFGTEILGLTNESLGKLIEKILPIFIDHVRKVLAK